jgi:hypothetical protein
MHSQKILPLRLNFTLLLLGACAGCIGMSAQAGQKASGKAVSQPVAASSDAVRLKTSYTLGSLLDNDECEEDYVGQLMLGRRVAAAEPDISSTRTTKPYLTANLSEESPRNSYSSDTITLAAATKEDQAAPAGRALQAEKLALSATRPEAPAPAPITVDLIAPASAGAWEIALTDKTLNAAIARWATSAGWQLLWELPVDYAVEARTTVPGTFEEAVEMVAKSMETAEIPMKAIFYRGNKVLRIVPRGMK